MADFCDVIHDWRRMCAAHNEECRDRETGEMCRLFDIDNIDCWMAKQIDDKTAARLEADVSEWAGAHPEVVWPTWADWLIEQGILAAYATPESYMEDVSGARTYLNNSVRLCLRALETIPEETCAKLGIEPKAVRRRENRE